ncbi:MAG: XkdF-like putative serine protease domain-containing protein [Candidatus Cloacimonetes bacterium]|nr:XkdF-like putative serine protease domain-containing protein [Candidatus Cloacimonadota bacterium]
MAKLKKLNVVYVSLVKNPANKKDIVYKSADGKFTDEKELKITKSTAEGMVYGTVYSPNEKDSQGDWADAETIKQAAHDFVAKGALSNVDKEHDEKLTGAKVVESHIDEKGAWQVGIKMDPSSEEFKKVQKGEIKGLSMGAYCEKSDEEPSTDADKTPDETAKILKSVVDSLEKVNERLEKIEKGVDKVPKSRQISIDGESVKIEKGGDEAAFQEFNFSSLD